MSGIFDVSPPSGRRQYRTMQQEASNTHYFTPIKWTCVDFCLFVFCFFFLSLINVLFSSFFIYLFYLFIFVVVVVVVCIFFYVFFLCLIYSA